MSEESSKKSSPGLSPQAGGSAAGGIDQLSTRSKWTILVVLTTVFVVATVLLSEVAVRVRQTIKYGSAKTVENTYILDKQLNLRIPRPNLNTGRIRTNSLGFRGPEIAVPKPSGTLRIAFLGASTTWCAEVSGNDKVWAHLVTKSVQAGLSGITVDYVNGGVPGYTVSSSLRNLDLRVAPLQPDVVVIYHSSNDMSGELRELAVRKGVARHAEFERPSWLSDYSLLWNLAEKNWRVFLAQKRVQANVDRLQIDDRDVLGVAFRRDLTNLLNTAQKHARIVAVATFSTQLRRSRSAEQNLGASASALYYMPFMTPDGLIVAFERYNQVIREVARATGAILIEHEEDIAGDPQHFVDTVHFTDAGSFEMAKRVSGVLLKSLQSATHSN